jgi:hypothetical protein
MKILKLPLTDSYFITLFEGYEGTQYSLSTSLSGTVLHNKKYIETAFQSNRFPEHKMFGKVCNMVEEDAKKIMESAGLEAPYINYVDRELTFDSALSSFMSFLLSEKWITSGNTWLIIPKPSKQLKGKKMLMEFSVGAMDFGYGEGKMDLEVFMTPITKVSKSITFSMRIPKFLYDKCMTDSDIKARPLKDSIECDTIASLHSLISKYVNQAHSIWVIEKNAKGAKKVIGINFSSSEISTRDDYNHGYTGQKISTTFNFCVCYQTKDGGRGRDLFTFKKLQHGTGSTERGVKGIIDSELQGHRNWIGRNPDIIMGWTQEREDFLTSLEGSFRKLSENLNNFLKDLDEEKMELLIQNKELLKLN